jgi:hypothetical protein
VLWKLGEDLPVDLLCLLQLARPVVLQGHLHRLKDGQLGHV